MERVKIGEKYWYLVFFGGEVLIYSMIERNFSDDDEHFAIGNYFHTKEEAESMAEKIRSVLKGARVLTPLEEKILSRKVEAVLSGADVIKMPSEEEIENEALENNWIHKERGDCNYPENLCVEIFKDGAEWLKSQLTKEE